MKVNRVKSDTMYVKYLPLLAAFLLFFLLSASSASLASASDSISPIKQWHYSWRDPITVGENLQSWLNKEKIAQQWQAIGQPKQLPKSNDKTSVWFQTSLPEIEPRELSLFIPPVYMYITGILVIR